MLIKLKFSLNLPPGMKKFMLKVPKRNGVDDPNQNNDDETLMMLYFGTILAFYVFYTIFGDRRRLGGNMGACYVVSAVNYFLLLSCIFLTLVECIHCVHRYHLREYSWKKAMRECLHFKRFSLTITVVAIVYGRL